MAQTAQYFIAFSLANLRTHLPSWGSMGSKQGRTNYQFMQNIDALLGKNLTKCLALLGIGKIDCVSAMASSLPHLKSAAFSQFPNCRHYT